MYIIRLIKEAFRNYYFKVIALGFAFSFSCSMIFDMYGDNKLDIVIREDYTVGQFVFWFGGVGRDFIWLLAAYRAWKSNLFYKICLRFYFDLLLVDLGYLIFSNPHTINRSKWEMVVITMLVFVFHCIIFRNRKK